MNRKQLRDEIYQLCVDERSTIYALAVALNELTLEQLGLVFDRVADEHDRRVGGAGSNPRGRVNVVAVPAGEKYVPTDPDEIVLDLRD
jgi:hypothetical protein